MEKIGRNNYLDKGFEIRTERDGFNFTVNIFDLQDNKLFKQKFKTYSGFIEEELIEDAIFKYESKLN